MAAKVMVINTLIITVGTRQVGWRSPDGIIRSLGADGARGVPSHVDELYEALGESRGTHEESIRCSVRDLGERLFLHCLAENDFSSVVLLLDDKIIEKEVLKDLKNVILWGTHQPETVSWQYRRMDTLWLAELMAGALKQRYPELGVVEVWSPTVKANDHLAIIEMLENKLMSHAQSILTDDEQQDLTFLVQNRGSVPAIANALEICAAAIVRQYGVKLLIPEEPNPIFIQDDQGRFSAQCSTFYRSMPLGKYFWPIEKPKIISAWRQGNFSEAKLWLMAHRDRYKGLCDLAEFLAIAVNGDIKKATTQIKNQWINSKWVKEKAPGDQHAGWLSSAESLQTKNQSIETRYAWIWERVFLYEISLEQGAYSNAFLSFAQTIESLLNLEYESEDWLKRGYLKVPEWISMKEYRPSLGDLIQGWETKHKILDHDPWHLILDNIRKTRNKIAHEGQAFEIQELVNRLSPKPIKNPTIEDLSNLKSNVLAKIAHPSTSLPERILLRSLYKWGLDNLQQ